MRGAETITSFVAMPMAQARTEHAIQPVARFGRSGTALPALANPSLLSRAGPQDSSATPRTKQYNVSR